MPTLPASDIDAPRRTSPDRDPRAFAAALRNLVPSAQPSVVFTSLTGLSVPAFSDECSVMIEEDGDVGYQIRYPILGPANQRAVSGGCGLPYDGGDFNQRLLKQTLRTPILGPAQPGASGYRGVVVHRWHPGYQPTQSDAALALFAVDRAAATVAHQRLIDEAGQHQRTAANLQQALTTNRGIGAAIGILMASHRITYPQAFDLLRSASQHEHRKLRDLAEDVVFTGDLVIARSAELTGSEVNAGACIGTELASPPV